MKNIFDTKTVSFQELIGNGKRYKIPSFQRDFSWREEHWEDLWQDLVDIFEDKEIQHYMGAIVLQYTGEKKVFVVVDGQQRITTLSLFILATVAKLNQLIEQGISVTENKERAKKILDTFIGEKSLASLYYTSKLTLNENNDSFYQSRMLEFVEPLNYAKLRDSEKLIYDAYRFFLNNIDNYFTAPNSEEIGEEIGKFIEKTSDALSFIQITVDDDTSAYTVFETLNARGVELTTTDLLKNYLFSIVAQLGKAGSEFKIIQENWREIVDTVGLTKFPIFLRFYLNARQKLVRKERLFKTLKKEAKSPKEAMTLMDKLTKAAYLYSAIDNPDDDYWNEYQNHKDIRQSLRELKLFGVSQPIPLLFAINEKRKIWLPEILKALVSISFRYNVVGKLNPNQMEKVYNKIAIKIARDEINELREIKDFLRELYIDDEGFANSFKAKTLPTTGRNKTLVKYILLKIENHLSNSSYAYDDANLTIEHILPENYNVQWSESFSGDADKYVYRLGNYTILESKKNKKVANHLFSEKTKEYTTSKYYLAKKVTGYDDWNISALNKYQIQLAKVAKTVWQMQ